MIKGMVSLLIPAYNSEKTIGKCLDSILKQTYKNIEIIVINDGSKDNTLKIIKKYEKKYDNIIIIDRENGGQAAARNDGLKKSIGEYIMCIDADDFIEENYLEEMHKGLIKNNSDVCISGCKRFNEKYQCTEEILCENPCWPNFIVCVPWGKLYKKEFFTRNNLVFPDVRYCEDNVFAVIVQSNTTKITKIDNSGYGYFCNNSSLTHSTFKSFKIDVLPANKYLLENINKDFYKNNEKLVYYFLAKQSIYYLLNAGKLESSKEFNKKNKEVMGWLNDNVPMFKKKPILPLLYPKDEIKIFKLVLFIYTILNKIGLIPLFSIIYCKNKIK